MQTIPLTKEQKNALQADEQKLEKARQIAVANGDIPEDYVEANRNKKFKVKAKEAGYVHLRVISRMLNAEGDDFINTEKILAIHAREFADKVKERAFIEFHEVEVIHDGRPKAPTTYGDLKGGEVEGVKLSPVANIALREKQLAAKENALSEKLEELDELTETMKVKSQSLDEKMSELDALIKKAGAQVQATAAPVTAPVVLVTEPTAPAANATVSGSGPGPVDSPKTEVKADAKKTEAKKPEATK